ncbi:MAG: type II toxin-antitoxin system RelB/DinJ family antitoxin [Oscillibacter sp.]|nr:type II toxin-antitoxin system RelB/DinJ family antitoxin [Oscillibacter sp.]
MAQDTITIDLDEYDRDRFHEFCDAAGLDVSTAVRIFIKAVLRESRIPFEVSGDPKMPNTRM